jgi:hypothetical protein
MVILLFWQIKITMQYDKLLIQDQEMTVTQVQYTFLNFSYFRKFLFVCLMVFNATFNNISGGLGENHRSVTDKLYHIMWYTSPWSRFELTSSVVIDTDCIGSCKLNYHILLSENVETGKIDTTQLYTTAHCPVLALRLFTHFHRPWNSSHHGWNDRLLKLQRITPEVFRILIRDVPNGVLCRFQFNIYIRHSKYQ